MASKVLIQSGSPTRYQPTPKKENIGSLRRITLGEKTPNKTNKTILLVGETGTGKSTLVNALVNYAMGVDGEDNVWSSQSGSQKSDVVVYQVFGFEGKTLPYSLTVIDTPGFGDTRGTEGDVTVPQRLLDLFCSDYGVHEIDAVGLVLKATENRLSDRLRYIFDSVSSLFGKDMEKNIVVLVTHSDGRRPENALKALQAAHIQCAKDEKNQPVYFLYNNCQDADRTEDIESLQQAVRITTKGMSQFTDFLEKTEAQKLEITVDVLKERIQLTACIQNLQDRTEMTGLKQKEVQQTQEALRENEQEMKNNENFTEEVNEDYKVKESVNGGRRWWWCGLFYKEPICCPVCEENCQYPGYPMIRSPGHSEVMKDGCCTVCTRKCPELHHVKENWIYVNKTRKVQKTIDDMRKKYEESKTNCEETTKLLEHLERNLEELQREKDQILDESFQHVVTLEHIALNVNSLSTFVHLDFLIEKMQEKGDTEKVQKLEDMKSRVDEGVLAALRYKLTAAVKEAMKNDHTSLRFKHIISKSVLVQSGSPTRYQLTPKKENIGSLRRMTLGEKNLSKTNKTILLVGETEKGKSTLVNALVNYAMGVDWEDNVWFEIVEDESSQSGSQKSDVVVYQVFGFEGKTLPYSLTVIDTPGFGDTRGTEGDVTIAQRLLDLFCSDYGVHEIDAVGLVLKATENRLSDRLRYIFDSVSSLFGKDMEKNIVVLVTHSDGRRPENALKALQAAHIQCAKDEKNQPVYFLYNNCQDADRTEDIESLQQAVRITTKGMSQFTDFLEKTEAQKLEITVDVLKERIQLTACIQNLQDRTEMTGLKQKEVQQTQEALRENEQEMKNNENFTEEVNEDYKVKESVNGGRRWWWCGLFYKEPICCPVCEENCQYPGYPMIRSPGHSEVMKDGCCTVCTRKCPELHHVKENWIYVNKTRKVQKTIDDMRKKYEESKTNCEETTKLLEHLERNLEELQREKDQILDESFQHVVTLEHIALNVNSLSTFVHLDFLIEKMQEKGDTEKVQKLEDMKSRVDEGVLAALRYKLTAAVKEAMKNDHTSLRFKHIISKSVLVQSGSPTRYQLTPKKENIGSLRRMTLGEKNLSKTNKTILLVGETEKGKSTLVNALVNYAMGVDWEDNVWFEIVEDESSQSGSQKSDVVVYQVFGFEGKTLPYSLTVIDTPGFGDTRGTEGDVTIAQRLLDLFCSDYGVHEIDAVGLVLKATENRLSDRLRYIFDSVSSLFGKDMEKNIVVLVTHSDGRRPENALKALQAAHIQCAKDEKNQPVYFLYNNCQDADRTEDIESLQQAVRITTKGMSQFTDFLEKTEAQKLEITVDVLKERIQLTACIQNLQDRTEMTGLKQKEVQQTQEALRENEQEMKNNENFTEEVNEDYKVKESVNGGRRWWWCGLFYKEPICCPVCEENCQYPGYPMIRSPGHSEVMKDGCCTVCTRKCPELHHVKENWIYVNKTRKVQKTIDDMRKKYEESKTNCEETTKLLEHLERNLEELQREKDQILDESFQHVVTLEHIALNVNSLSTFVHLDFLIEKMQEKGDTEKVQKLEDMKSRVDEGVLAALRYKLTAAVKEAMKNDHTSLRFKHIISKSVLVQSGSPTRYQLTPKKENIGSLRRMTLGEKNLSKTNKTILLVGETEKGKSTLVNALVNYAMGVDWEDNVWFEIVEDESSQSGSQKSDVVVYQVFGFEGKTLPYSLTVIDTPGFGDTRGTEGDVTIAQRLLDLFCSDYGVHEIDAVGLVLKATENRLSDRLRYIFDSVSSLFGKDMEKNIVVLVTHSDGRRPENALKALQAAHIQCAKDEKNQPVYFLYNNCQDADRTEDIESLQQAVRITTKGMSQFTDFLEKTEAGKLETVIRSEQTELTDCVLKLQERIVLTEEKQREILQNQNNEKILIAGGFSVKTVTYCPVCEEDCHSPCKAFSGPGKCQVMKGGCCTVCPRKCPLSDHVKEERRFAKKTRKGQKTLEDGTSAGSDSGSNLLEELQKEKDQLLDESFQRVVRLDQISLSVNSLSTYVHLDFLIEKMKEKGDQEKAQKLEEMKSQVEVRTRAGLQLVFTKLKAAVNQLKTQ